MKTYLVYLFLVYNLLSYSQGIQSKFISKITLEADQFIGFDDLDNLYYIKNNTFFKKSKTETLSYANVALGKIASVDIHNPFKIILFYKDFNAVLFLDNKLNELSNKIDFTTEVLFNNVLFVSHSSENNLWLFADDLKLHLYDFQNRSEKIQTQPISFHAPNFVPVDMKSTYKNVYLLGDQGIIQFNEYGNFIHFFEIENCNYFAPFKEGVLYFKEGIFYYHDKNEAKPIELEYQPILKEVYSNSSSINIYDGKFLYIFQLL